jgi:putative ATP-dependent endonuclease of OLD family
VRLLKHIEIVGFRGIARLSLDLSSTRVLIGENAWGKSSLLDALSLLLNSAQRLYKFHLEDFHVSPETEKISHQITIVLTFEESHIGQHQRRRFLAIEPLWIGGGKFKKRIYYQIEGILAPDGQVLTQRAFLNSQGEIITLENTNELAKQLMSFFPVLRISQECGLQPWMAELAESSERVQSEQLIEKTVVRLQSSSQQLSERELKQAIMATRSLFEHYLTPRFTYAERPTQPRRMREMGLKPISFRAIDDFSELLKMTAGKHNRAALLVMLGAFLRARGPSLLRRGSSPILLLEDPEARLHPINLLTSWAFLDQLPVQKVVTTNSCDLLATFKLNDIVRLVRHFDKTHVYGLDERHFLSDDFRRIAFHVRINRPASLLARCWLLVEGETELWLLTELARVCGYSFAAEGVRIVEFAQCGLSPLIKVAKDFGIEWHLLTDGDDAGKKYANQAKALLDQEGLRERLTFLPDKDIEHFLFNNGFSGVYLRQAKLKLADFDKLGVTKVIDKAIGRTSKPRLALAIAEAVEAQGPEAVPLLLRRMLNRLIALARSQAG